MIAGQQKNSEGGPAALLEEHLDLEKNIDFQ